MTNLAPSALGCLLAGLLGCASVRLAERDLLHAPADDACSLEPSPLPLGTSLVARTRAGVSQIASSCSRRAGPECSYAFQVPVRADLRATLASQNFDGALSLSSVESSRELACVDDSPLGDTHRARLDLPLEPGAYLLHVEGAGVPSGEFELFAELDPLPTLAQVCAAAEPLPDGTFVRGSTRGGASSFEDSCDGRGAGPDHLYTFTLERMSRVRVREQSDFDALLSLRGACGQASLELGCSDDGPSGSANLGAELPAGSYALVVDSYTRSEGGDYVLALEKADAPAAVDHAPRCSTLPTLREETLQELDTFYEQASTAATCGGDQAPEALYMFVLREPRRVRVFASDFEFHPVFSLRRACEYIESEVVCTALPRRGQPTDTSEQLVLEVELPAGDYMLGVDGQRPGEMGAGTVRLATAPAGQ